MASRIRVKFAIRFDFLKQLFTVLLTTNLTLAFHFAFLMEIRVGRVLRYYFFKLALRNLKGYRKKHVGGQ